MYILISLTATYMIFFICYDIVGIIWMWISKCNQLSRD